MAGLTTLCPFKMQGLMTNPVVVKLSEKQRNDLCRCVESECGFWATIEGEPVSEGCGVALATSAMSDVTEAVDEATEKMAASVEAVENIAGGVGGITAILGAVAAVAGQQVGIDEHQLAQLLASAGGTPDAEGDEGDDDEEGDD